MCTFLLSFYDGPPPHASATSWILHQAYDGSLGSVAVSTCVQQLVLEVLGDLYMRFTIPYRCFPYALVHLIFDWVPQDTKRRICLKFKALKECCLSDLFEQVILALWGQDLMQQPCLNFILMWALQELLVTRVVEFAHRNNKSVAAPKGHARPSNFKVMSDVAGLNRLGVLHGQAIGQTKKNRYRLRQHPKVQEVARQIKSMNNKRKRSQQSTGLLNDISRKNPCGNPKFFYLNKIRGDLTQLQLPQDEFNQRVASVAERYDNDPLVKQAARDAWDVAQHQVSGAAAAPNPADRREGTSIDGSVGVGGVGPWGLGDSFWLVAGSVTGQFLRENTLQGSLRPLAQKIGDRQNSEVTIIESEALQFCRECVPQGPTPTLGKTCCQIHPGFCQVKDRLDVKPFSLITRRLHSIRSASFAVILP